MNRTTINISHLLFLVLTILLLVLVRSEVKEYLQTVEAMQEDIAYAQQQAALSKENTGPAAEVLSRLDKSTDRIMLLAFVIIPLIYFILWVFSQGWIYAALKQAKDTREFLKKFAVISALYFLVIVVILYRSIDPTLTTDPPKITIPFLFVGLAHLIFTLIITNLDGNIRTAIKKTFSRFNLAVFLWAVILAAAGIAQIGAGIYLYLLMFVGSPASAYLAPSVFLILAAVISTELKAKVIALSK